MVASCRHLTRIIHASGSQLGKRRDFSPRKYLSIYADIFGCHNCEVGVGQGATSI